jgi:hypothetical protein
MKGLRFAGSTSGEGRFSRVAAAVLLVALLLPTFANACPVCWGGDPNSPTAKGTSNAVLFLLGIVGFVQIGFVALFVTFWRRSRELKKFRDSLAVIEGGSH